jgi:predicted permease
VLTRLGQLATRIRATIRPAELDRELDDELEAHLTMLAEEHQRRGMTPDQAQRSARLALGGPTQIREAHRDVRGVPLIDTLVQDLRHTVRAFRRDAGVTTFAMLIVGLGIGASSTVFSVVNALLIRPLPFSDPSRLVWIANDEGSGDLSARTVPVGPFLDLRDHNRSFSDIAAYYAFYGVGDIRLTGDGEPERLSGIPVSHNLFSLLGVQPQLGRLFTAEECRRDDPFVLLSAGLWQRRFASDPGIIGRTLRLNDRPVTVLGVMPSSFDFGSVFAPGRRIDLFVPLPLTPDLDRRGNTLSMIGRLRPGVTLQQARAEAGVLSESIRVLHDREELRFTVGALEEHVRGHLRPAVFVLACAVGVVMLIVCANLSSLQLARASARHKEMAIRVALGAGHGRLIQQMLTESVVLSCCASVLGLAFAVAGTRLVAGMDAISLPLRASVRLDLGALGFTLSIAILTGLILGLASALQVPAYGVHDSLKEANRGSSGGRRHNRIRATLVVAEIAFTCVLLVGAGLLMRSFLRVLDVDLGFRPERAAALRVDPSSGYSTRTRRNAYVDEVLRLVKSVPGIEAAGVTDVLPLGQNRSWSVGAKDREYSKEHLPPEAFVRIVSDGYLRAMGIPLRAGRDLTDRDSATGTPVIMVNEALARTLWPGRNPIGQRVKYVTDVDREVVGVVGNVRHLALEQGSGAEMYVPIRQTSDYSSIDLVVRTSLPPESLAAAVRAALKPIDPNLPAHEFRPLQQLVDSAVSPRRFVVFLLAGFSAFALILASLGIYGIISYSVSQRTQEMGIRMALGASAGSLQVRFVLQTLRMAAIGILTGAALALVLSRSLRGLLFGVTANDPLTFFGTVFILTVVAAAAGYVPARRTSRVDPMAALRSN